MIQKPPQPARRGVSEFVHQTILDLHNAGRVATRQIVVKMTGLSYSVVDDHVKRMVEDGRLRRVVNGVVEPVEQMPPARAISVTAMPNGMAKLEVGEDCLDLNPTEQRFIGRLLAGSAAELTGMQNGRELADTVADLTRQLQVERRKRELLQDSVRRLQRVPRQDEFPFP